MNNTEKKLDALIDALGFDVKASTVSRELHNPYDSNVEVITSTDYKLTKRDERFINILKEHYLELLAGYEAWQNHE